MSVVEATSLNYRLGQSLVECNFVSVAVGGTGTFVITFIAVCNWRCIVSSSAVTRRYGITLAGGRSSVPRWFDQRNIVGGELSQALQLGGFFGGGAFLRETTCHPPVFGIFPTAHLVRSSDLACRGQNPVRRTNLFAGPMVLGPRVLKGSSTGVYRAC